MLRLLIVLVFLSLSLSLVTAFALKSILSKYCYPAFFFSLSFAWNIFFHPFTFSLYVSLGLKYSLVGQHIDGSSFF